MLRFTALMALLAILFYPAFAPAGAQDNGTPTKLAFRTNVVLVPVVVTDKQGNHIKGLTRDDFEVKEDGKVQKLASFEEINAEATPVQQAVLAPNAFSNQLADDRPRELEIIALDLLNTPFIAQADARRGLIDFLSKSVSQNALLAFVVFQPNRVTLVHNFTSDPAILVSAVKKLQARVSARDTSALNVRGDADAEAAQLEAIFSGADLPATGSGITAQIAAARAQGQAVSARMDASRQSQEGLETLECMQQVAQYFSSVPGRKSLVWASTAFPFSLGAMTGEVTRGTTLDDWQRTVRMLQDANIAVYPVDVGGLVTKAPNTQIAIASPVPTSSAEGGVAARSNAMEAVAQGRMQDPTEGKHDTMRQMAERTGGQPFYNNNDLENLFRRATQDSAQYYMLAYYTNEGGKNGWRKLEVKVHHESVQVRSRNGFFFTKTSQDTDASRQVEELLALTSSLNFTALPISGTWQQVEPSGNNRKVHFTLSIPAGAVDIDADHENHINIDFLAVAMDANGKEAGKISQRLDRKLPAAGVTQIQASGLAYANVLTLPPGQYKVHLAVRDNLSGKVGSVVSPLKVE